MNINDNNYLRKVIILLAVNCILYAQPINATEWQVGFESRSGFSDFTPPASFDKYQNNFNGKQWASGSSFDEENKVRYSAEAPKNPWKPVKLVHYKKTFSSQRPWGNVPDRMPENKNNMSFYDQRFKQWSHQQDLVYRNNGYGQSAAPFYDAYGYSALGYNSPVNAPPIHPGLILNSGGYGRYPGTMYPSTGIFSRSGI